MKQVIAPLKNSSVWCNVRLPKVFIKSTIFRTFSTKFRTNYLLQNRIKTFLILYIMQIEKIRINNFNFGTKLVYANPPLTKINKESTPKIHLILPQSLTKGFYKEHNVLLNIFLFLGAFVFTSYSLWLKMFFGMDTMKKLLT